MRFSFKKIFVGQTTTESPDTTTTDIQTEQTTTNAQTDNPQTTQEVPQTTTESANQETTEQPKEETSEVPKEETTTSIETETTTSQETTTLTPDSTTKKPSNGNSSCPEVGEGQALFVCPTGFRRHPQDCNMFYQCTESPETSHLSIVTFKCPNETIYDEDAIMCRDRRPGDDCHSKMNDTLRVLFDLESNKSPAVS